MSGPPPAYRLGISRSLDDPDEFVAVVFESPGNLLQRTVISAVIVPKKFEKQRFSLRIRRFVVPV